MICHKNTAAVHARTFQHSVFAPHVGKSLQRPAGRMLATAAGDNPN